MTDSTIMSWSVQAVNITMRALGRRAVSLRAQSMPERPGNQASIRTTSGGGWECGMSRRVGILLLAECSVADMEPRPPSAEWGIRWLSSTQSLA